MWEYVRKICAVNIVYPGSAAIEKGKERQNGAADPNVHVLLVHKLTIVSKKVTLRLVLVRNRRFCYF